MGYLSFKNLNTWYCYQHQQSFILNCDVNVMVVLATSSNNHTTRIVKNDMRRLRTMQQVAKMHRIRA